jgi:serine/threonine protein kinase
VLPPPSRDIKSQNILLTGFASNKLDGQSCAKVADFGTVRADNRGTTGTLSTKVKTHASTQTVVGTLPYMVSILRARHTACTAYSL